MKKDFLSIKDLNKAEVEDLFLLTERLKKTRIEKGGTPTNWSPLQNKTFALVFEKPSLRTRVTFETGIYELGGNSIYLSQQDIGLGTRETIKDGAQNLSQWVAGIIARVFAHQTVVELAKYASIPVINALSDYEHPCQALADLFTIYERFKSFKGLKFVYIGDGNNVCRSLMLLSEICGLEMWVATPKGYEPTQVDTTSLQPQQQSQQAGTQGNYSLGYNSQKSKILNDPIETIREADIVYTDVWVSMGQEAEREKRLKIFKEYQVNSKLLKYAKPNCLIMHCLPAHRGEEISSEILDSPNSIVLEQAANRLYTQKALLIKLYSKPLWDTETSSV